MIFIPEEMSVKFLEFPNRELKNTIYQIHELGLAILDPSEDIFPNHPLIRWALMHEAERYFEGWLFLDWLPGRSHRAGMDDPNNPWESLGFCGSIARKYRDAGFDDPLQALRWFSEGFAPFTALRWLGRDITDPKKARKLQEKAFLPKKN